MSDDDRAAFATRLGRHLPELHALYRELYGETDRAEKQLTLLERDLLRSWTQRAPELQALDARREADPGWFLGPETIGGVCYVDRFAGTVRGMGERIPYLRELGLRYLHLMPLFAVPENGSDGGYAVSSYRDLRPDLGTMDDLEALAADLRANEILLTLDFVFNHTSNEHEWARRARDGEQEFEDFYLVFADRELPDEYERTTREIFPDDHSGSFVPLPDGRWVWSTFHSYQWDLDYRNPAVFRAMAGELLALANRGVDVLRMDAVAFAWKELGTSSENLPQVHTLLRLFNRVCAIAAPGVLLKSEAIVHPDQVVGYVSPDQCRLSYNPLEMALIWSTLATRDVGLLDLALSRRHALPEGTAWVDYVRSHDDIGWTFADEDAWELGIDPVAHRRFLTDFYTGRFEGSFARGLVFQENPRTGDARVAGTTASLLGLEQHDPGAVSRILLAHSIVLTTGGIPLLYLGDEVGQTNDASYLDDPATASDSRWAGRPRFPAERYAERGDLDTEAGAIYLRMRHLLQVRAATPEFRGNRLLPFDAHSPRVLAYQRPGERTTVLVLANVGDEPETIEPLTLSGLDPDAVDLVSGAALDLRAGLVLAPHQFAWLRVASPAE